MVAVCSTPKNNPHTYGVPHPRQHDYLEPGMRGFPHTWLPNFTPNGVACGMNLE